MQRIRAIPRSRLAEIVVTAVLLLAWFACFRPLMLGGLAEYVMVAGHSMEPTFFTGDLAITQRQATYAIGDVVAYKTDQGVVIHRIVGGDAAAGYVVRGDNRRLADIWRPQPGAILGKVWFTVPQVGNILALARRPSVLAALVAAAVFFIAFTSRTSGRPLRKPKSTVASLASADGPKR